MGDQGQGSVANGDRCEVVAGTHRGKAGTVRDYKLSKTGHATITVRQDSGVCFKTLARNVEKRGVGVASSLCVAPAVLLLAVGRS